MVARVGRVVVDGVVVAAVGVLKKPWRWGFLQQGRVEMARWAEKVQRNGSVCAICSK